MEDLEMAILDRTPSQMQKRATLSLAFIEIAQNGEGPEHGDMYFFYRMPVDAQNRLIGIARSALSKSTERPQCET